MLPTYRWIFYHSVTLCNILSLNSCAPLWHFACKKMEYVSNNKRNFQFQVGYMSFLTLKKGIQGEIIKTYATRFDTLTSQAIIRVIKKYNTNALALFMFSENRKSLVFKVHMLVIYCIINKHIYIDFLTERI